MVVNAAREADGKMASGAGAHTHHAFVMRSISPLGVLGLAGIMSSSFSCSHKGAQPGASTAQAASSVSLELQKGPAPALPNPMLVTDSVHGGKFESCYQGFHASGSVEKDLAQMTSMCGPPNSMKPVSPVFQGNQSQKEPIARYTFRGEMGRCYRIFSASDRTIQDMDMAMNMAALLKT